MTETGLALLFHSHAFPCFWVDVFSTAAYIINRLPVPLLRGKSPFELLYDSFPNYENFDPFGCRVFLCLRDYMPNKFLSLSLPPLPFPFPSPSPSPSPVAFLAFFWVTTPLTKGFVVLILPLLGYVSPAMLNLMRLTFSFSLPLRLNPYPSSNSQIFWNPVFSLQPCYHLPLCLIPGILHNPDLPRVVFVLIQWMSLCGSMILL